jgi:hypothetical protein
VRSVGPSLVVEGLPNNAMEPSAHELTLARRGSSRNVGRMFMRNTEGYRAKMPAIVLGLCVLPLCVLGLFLLRLLAFEEPRRFACESSPTLELLPNIIAPMTGASPVWLVDGSAPWPGELEPLKTVWVLRRTTEPVRISGHRLDAPGTAQLRRGSDTPSDVFFVANPSNDSVKPGGAPPVVMRSFVFLSSHVFYPSPGCWLFTVHIGQQEFRIVRELKTKGLRDSTR